MSYVLPGAIVLLVGYALVKKVDIYDAFVEGAGEALPMLLHILPYMAAMLLAMAVLRGSGALDAFIGLVTPALAKLGLPAELAPLFFLRPFSGSASLALLEDVFSAYGADSHLGYAGSIMLGSTETIFYTVALYFGSVGVKRTRYAVPVALLSGVAGSVAALLLTRLYYS